MKTVILKTTDGDTIYVNPEQVQCIAGGDHDSTCIIHMAAKHFIIAGHKHLVATILATEPTRPDKFVSYKDWEWHDEEGSDTGGSDD